MVKKLATYLASEVQRPTMQALEHTKGVRAELGARAKANSDLMSAEKRMVGPAQLNELRENLQRTDAKAKQSLDEVRPPSRLLPRPFTQPPHPFFVGQVRKECKELAGRCIGGIVSCQRVMAVELGRLELGEPDRTTLASLTQSAPPGCEEMLAGGGGGGRAPLHSPPPTRTGTPQV